LDCIFKKSQKPWLQFSGAWHQVFLDDRVLVAPGMRRLPHRKQLWKNWSRRLGLVENEDKVIAFAPNGYNRHAFVRNGFPERNVRSQIRILGIGYVSPAGDEVGEEGAARISQAVQIAARLSKAPVPLRARSSLIPKASWGWWLQDFPTKGLNDLFKHFRAVAYVHRMCSRDLS
jgi:hypothetical protein